MDEQGYNRLDHLCGIVYGGVSATPTESLEAHKTLLTLQTSALFIPQLKFLISNGDKLSVWTLFFASNSLLHVITNDWNNISPKERSDLYRFVFEQISLFSQKQDLNQSMFVINGLIRVFCRISRLGYISENFSKVMNDVTSQIKTGALPPLIGIKLVEDLVGEFNSGPSFKKSATSLRYVQKAFRERDGLNQAFQTSLSFVGQYSNPLEERMLKRSLDALIKCLSFDFIGDGDDQDDSSVCLYLPADWANKIARASSLERMFDIFNTLSGSDVDISDTGAAALCLEVLNLLVSVRRSVFEPDQRVAYLVAFLKGTSRIMENKPLIRKSEACLHQFCRLLSGIKNHFQLVDLSQPPEYQAWLHHLGNFTNGVLNAWQSVSSRTTNYLLKLWASLILPTPFLQRRDGFRLNKTTMESPNMPAYLKGLPQHVSQVFESFLRTRGMLSAAEAMIESGMSSGISQSNAEYFGEDSSVFASEEFLAEEGLLLETLAPVTALARFQFSTSFEAISNLYQGSLMTRERVLSGVENGEIPGDGFQTLLGCQANLAFMTYMIGTIIGGHVSRIAASVIEDFEDINLELSALVFKLILSNQAIEQMLQKLKGKSELTAMLDKLFSISTPATYKLELATLYFIRCFQNLYIENRAKSEAKDERDALGNLRNMILTGSDRELQDANARMGMDSMANWISSGHQIMFPPMFQLAIPSLNPSLGSISTHNGAKTSTGLLKDRSSEDDKEMKVESKSNTSERKVGESLAQNESELSSTFMEKMVGVQKSLAGMSNGETDKVLLELSLQRVFSLLQQSQSSFDGEVSEAHDPASVIVERVLTVLHLLSVGVTVVHAQGSLAPKLMSSGKLLLEAETIQHLLTNPSSRNFSLLDNPKHSKSRAHLMATLAKLLFTQIKSIPYAGALVEPQTLASFNITNVDALLQKSSEMQSRLRKHNATPSFDGPARRFILVEQNGERVLIGADEEAEDNALEDGALNLDSDNNQMLRISQDELADTIFIQFMQPLTENATEILNVFNNTSSPEQLRDANVRRALCSLFTDLRGILSSCTISREYELVFAWLFPDRIRLITFSAEMLWDDNVVVSSILKLLKGLVLNKGSRINFPSGSSGGVFLFKESCNVLLKICEKQLQVLEREKASQAQESKIRFEDAVSDETVLTNLTMITGFKDSEGSSGVPTDNGAGLLSMASLKEAVAQMGKDLDGSDAMMRLKALNTDGSSQERSGSILKLDFGAIGPGYTVNLDTSRMTLAMSCVVVLTRMLQGKFGSLGTFEIYNDKTLENTIRYVLELALASTPSHTLSFPKMRRKLVILLELLIDTNVLMIVALPSGIFARVMAVLTESICSSERSATATAMETSSTVRRASTALFNLVKFRCRTLAYSFFTNNNSLQLLNSQYKGYNYFLHMVNTQRVLNPAHRARGEKTLVSDFERATEHFRAHDANQPHLFQEILKAILGKLFLEDIGESANYTSVATRGNSLTKPLLGLIISSPSTFNSFKEKFLLSQSRDRSEEIEKGFNNFFEVLNPGIMPSSGGLAPNPENFESLLKKSEAFGRELLAFAKKIKSV